MALGSLRTSSIAATAEYSMLKGRPVLPSLSSLMAFVEVSLESFWKGRSGRRWGACRARAAHLLELGEELGHGGEGEGGWGGGQLEGRL